MRVFFVNARMAFGSAVKTEAHVEKLRALGITHVLSLRRYKSRRAQRFQFLSLAFRDNGRPRPTWFYRDALKFYKGAMSKAESKVFVMCHHGMCRSPSMTYFLLRASGANQQEAERLVFKAKPKAKLRRGYRLSSEDFLRTL